MLNIVDKVDETTEKKKEKILSTGETFFTVQIFGRD